MKHLFIGGTLSGKTLNVPEGNTYRKQIIPGTPELPSIEEVYHKHLIITNHEFSIYLHCSIKPEHIVKLLKLSHGQEEA